MVPGDSIVTVSWCSALFSPSSSGDATLGMNTWKQSVRGNSGREEQPRGVGGDPAERKPLSRSLGVMETGPATPSVPKCYK